MKSQEDYLSDIAHIKDMMNRSSRFISLSGMSGVSAGIFALIGAYFAHQTIYSRVVDLGYKQVILVYDRIVLLLIIAVSVLILSLVSGIFFTSRKAKKNGQKLWDVQTKRLLINLFIPLFVGGALSLTLLFKGYIGLVAPLTLIFYGLGLLNASHFTLSEIRSLGMAQIALGLISLHYIGYGLYFWAIGFGVLHVVYGIIMQIKYKS
jgi:hypothetical protein